MKPEETNPKILLLISRMAEEVCSFQSAILRRAAAAGIARAEALAAMRDATFECLWGMVWTAKEAKRGLKDSPLDARDPRVRKDVGEEIIKLAIADIEKSDPGHIYTVSILKRQRGLKD